ncbi:hypothetical protein HDU98_011734 [Podochytrium sp. JEL0797]|nr:hypothetical protein HDU98_011734 [Podochytrium sp. JEL0797]
MQDFFPREVWVEIVKYMDTSETARCRLLSHSFNALITSPPVAEHLLLRECYYEDCAILAMQPSYLENTPLRRRRRPFKSIPQAYRSMLLPTVAKMDGNARMRWMQCHFLLAGPIPVKLGKLVNLTGLVLSKTGLSGPIPTELGNLINLTHLNLDHNALTGSIPTELGKLANLRGLDLSYNVLTGSISASLGIVGMRSINLRNNKLTGSIPDKLGLLSSVDLSNNRLEGDIPGALMNMNMGLLMLRNNRLVGLIPTMSPASFLISLDVGKNRLEGRVSIDLQQRVRDLRVDGNPHLEM